MNDKRTAENMPSRAPAGKPKGGAREGAGRKAKDATDKRKAHQIYCTDEGWKAAREHVAALGFASLGDWAESLRHTS